MHKAHYPFFFLIITFMLCYTGSIAQDTINKSFTPQFEKGKYYMITSIYGTNYRGPVIEEGLNDLVIVDKKTNTKHKLQKKEIKDVSVINASKVFQAPRFDDNYYTNYYMLAENALPFKKGGFNSTSHYLAFSNMNYSFNEHWGISMNLFTVLPISLGVKCSFKISETIYFGGNIFGYATPNERFDKISCPFFGSAARITKGDNISNFTIGAGIIAVSNSINSNPRRQRQDPFFPVYYLNFAYANRFSKHFSLNIENFLFPQTIAYHQGTININLTGVSIKWLRNYSDHWNLGCYGLYIGDFTNLNKNSQVAPIPYIGYSCFFN